MIRKLLATTALVTMTLGGAYAAEQPAKADGQVTDRFLTTDSGAAMASRLIGEPVYTNSANDAQSLGNINDLLVGSDGEVDAAIIGVGGFLGIGEKNVAVNYQDLKLTPEGDGSYRVVLETTKQELEAAPAFDVSAVTQKHAMAPEGKAADQTASKDATAAEPKASDQLAAADNKDATASEPKASNQMAAADNKDAMKKLETTDQMAASDKQAAQPDEKMAAQREAIAAGRQNYALVDVTTMGTDELIGASVYSHDNDNLGEIGEFILNKDGKIEAVVIDVGGFLGIGEKPVAVAFEELEFRTDDNGKIYVYSPFTQDQLESATQYDEEAYKQNRDQVLVRSAS